MAKKEEYIPGTFKTGDRLGYYGPDGQYRTHKAHFAKPRVPVSTRIGHAWRAANRPREFIFTPGKGIRAIFLLTLLGLGVLLAVDQLVKISQVEANPYPVFSVQQLWGYSVSTSGLAGWNCRSATLDGAPSIVLNANTTHSASCVTKQPMDLSVVSAKHLEVLMVWALNATGTYPSELGWYFSRNGTLPTEIADYSPATDKNVVLLHRSVDGGGGIESGVLFIQRKESDAVNSGDPGGCGAGGTVFVCGDGSLPDTTAEISGKRLVLNFTGNPGSANPNSIFTIGETPATEATTTNLPWFQFQAQQYYLGIYVRARSPDPVAIEWISGVAGFRVNVVNPVVSLPEAPTQRIDTGGFFGPIIRALISVGLFIIEQITQFFSWVLDLFVDAMDVVGGFFGLGAIGTAIRDALVGVATWVSSVFGTIFGQSINIATAISNGLLVFAQVAANYWTNLTSWLSALKDLAGIWWTFIGFWGTISFSGLVTIWLVLGVIMSWNSQNGFFQWSRGTWIATAMVFTFMWEIGYRAFQVILDVKRLLAQWI